MRGISVLLLIILLAACETTNRNPTNFSELAKAIAKKLDEKIDSEQWESIDPSKVEFTITGSASKYSRWLQQVTPIGKINAVAIVSDDPVDLSFIVTMRLTKKDVYLTEVDVVELEREVLKHVEKFGDLVSKSEFGDNNIKLYRFLAKRNNSYFEPFLAFFDRPEFGPQATSEDVNFDFMMAGFSFPRSYLQRHGASREFARAATDEFFGRIKFKDDSLNKLFARMQRLPQVLN